MNRSFRLWTACLLPLAAALACSQFPGSAAGEVASLPAGESLGSITHDGRERTYRLYVPASVDWSRPVPLVFVFHGGTGNADSAVRMSGFDPLADRFGFLVIYPNGTGRLSDEILLTWNAGTCCGYAQEEIVDDVGMVRALIASLEARVTIDPKRIYASGMSNGGILSHRLACEAADLFAAVAPVAGTLNLSPCRPAAPVSVIAFHGTDDRHLPYAGGIGPESLAGVDFASVGESMGFWTGFNRCAPDPIVEEFADIRHETWTGCAAGTAVELYTILGGGHAWPGSEPIRARADPPTDTIAASELIWDFFAGHPKP